jgi:hypothetical protein
MSENMKFNIAEHLKRHISFSEKTFGPGPRVGGVINHIEKELEEVRSDPTDLEEWIDIWMLAMDGAWRSLSDLPVDVRIQFMLKMLVDKQTKNENRKWPDWREVDTEKAIEHIRE